MTEFDSELNVIIAEIKKEFKHFLIKRKELIIKLGTAYEKVVANPESICEEIKNVLRDEIAQKLISSRAIERYCLDEWKTKTKPRNDNLSFPKPVEEMPQPDIAVTQEGKSVIMNETSINTETYPKGGDGVNQPHYQPQQNATGVDNNNEERNADSKKESDKVTPPLNYNAELSIKKPENSEIDKQNKVFDFHFSMLFEELEKDMAAVFKITQGIGRIWFEGRVDLETGRVAVYFCGHRQQKNDSIISTGDGRILDLGRLRVEFLQ